MSLGVPIPKIDITSECEDDDDDHSPLLLVDALTDVEDLYDDNNATNEPIKTKKLKLKIKLNDDSDAVTDLEDFEASDTEENQIIKHSEPIHLDDLDLECGTFEETYKKQIKTLKGKKKLRTQMSTSTRNQDQSLRLAEYTEDGLTDVENFDTDSELDLTEDVPETVINLDMARDNDVNISENFKNQKKIVLPVAGSDGDNSDDSAGLLSATQFLSTLSLSPNLSDLTDVEVLDTDSDGGKIEKKPRHRRRRCRAHFSKDQVTDTEDLSEIDGKSACVNKKPKRKSMENSLVKRTQSLNFDSDNESNNAFLPFAVCKKVAVKKRSSLRIPEFDTDALTDTEDFPGETPDVDTVLVDEVALEAKLDEMAACYSQVKENHKTVKGKSKGYITRTRPAVDEVGGQNDTDEDECHTDNDNGEEPSVLDDTLYGIKFSESKQPPITKSKSLNIPLVYPEVDGLTDVENIDTSPDEEQSSKLPLAFLKKSVSLTDEEDMEGEINTCELPEILLPAPTRNLVLLKEDDSMLPTVKILPLDEEVVGLFSPIEGNSTDENELSTDELDVPSSYFPRAPTPDLPFMDGGSTKVVENMQKTSNVLTMPQTIIESKTDTEEILMENTPKKRRNPKFKYLHEKSCLNVKKIESAPLTDTEDLYLSDGGTSLNIVTCATDVENLDTSESDTAEPKPRALSCTPQHMRELGGEMVLSRDNSGPIPLKDRLLLVNRIIEGPSATASPTNTDTEDLVGSADEDFSGYHRAMTATPIEVHADLDQESSTVLEESNRKFDDDSSTEVMYLKGGGYGVIAEDISLVEDVLCFGFNGDEKRVLLNLREGTVSFGAKTELDASRRIIEPESAKGPAATTVDQHTVPEGGEAAGEADATTSSTRKEAHEAHSTTSQRVTDQHQLSDEMRELLKELEKESKQ